MSLALTALSLLGHFQGEMNMKTLVAAAVLLFASTAFAQYPMGYTQNPIWQTPVYQYQPNYYDPYFVPQWGHITRQRVGNQEFMRGTGVFQGYSGRTLNFGYGQSRSVFRYQPYYYGW